MKQNKQEKQPVPKSLKLWNFPQTKSFSEHILERIEVSGIIKKEIFCVRDWSLFTKHLEFT